MPKTMISEQLYQYNLAINPIEHPVLKELREFTKKTNSAAGMQIPPDQGIFMAFLAKLTRANKYLEIGVFTGYSTLAMTLAMGESGQVFALDNNPEVVEVAKQYWQKAGVTKQVNLYLDNALNSLDNLMLEHKNSFDIAFIDADKANYIKYYEYCYELTKPNGLIIVDNVLFHGQVLEPHPARKVQAIKEFNQFIHNDSRVDICSLALYDGITLIRKLSNA